MSKEEAQKTYDDAFQRHQSAYADLEAARINLDEYLREEEAARHAVFLGFEEGDPDGIEMAKNLATRRREQKEAVKMAASEADIDGPVGGVQ